MAGGLMSYGENLPSMYRRAAYFVDRIFKGARPADLPVEQATKFDMVINLRTAKAIGLTIPDSILAHSISYKAALAEGIECNLRGEPSFYVSARRVLRGQDFQRRKAR